MTGAAQDGTDSTEMHWFEVNKSQTEVPARDYSSTGHALWRTIRPNPNVGITSGVVGFMPILLTSVAIVGLLSIFIYMILPISSSSKSGQFPAGYPISFGLLQTIIAFIFFLTIVVLGAIKLYARFNSDAVPAKIRNRGVACRDDKFQHFLGINTAYPRSVIDAIADLYDGSVQFPTSPESGSHREDYRDIVETADSILILRFADLQNETAFGERQTASDLLEKDGESALPFGVIEASSEQAPFDLAIDIAIAGIPREISSGEPLVPDESDQPVPGGRLQREVDLVFEKTAKPATDAVYFGVEISIAGRTGNDHTISELNSFLETLAAPLEGTLSGETSHQLVSTETTSVGLSLTDEKQKMLSPTRKISIHPRRRWQPPFGTERRGYPATPAEIPLFLLTPGNRGGSERTPLDQTLTSSIPTSSHHVIRQTPDEETF